MKPRVYVETSIVSYLTARLSRDLVLAAHQQITQQWWAERQEEFELFASLAVVNEAGAGNQEAARRRLEILKTLPLLDITAEVSALAEDLVRAGPIPVKSGGGCRSHRGFSGVSDGLPLDLELYASGQRRHAAQNRECLS